MSNWKQDFVRLSGVRLEARTARPGEVRHWKSGDMMKQHDGSWLPVKKPVAPSKVSPSSAPTFTPKEADAVADAAYSGKKMDSPEAARAMAHAKKWQETHGLPPPPQASTGEQLEHFDAESSDIGSEAKARLTRLRQFGASTLVYPDGEPSFFVMDVGMAAPVRKLFVDPHNPTKDDEDYFKEQNANWTLEEAKKMTPKGCLLTPVYV